MARKLPSAKADVSATKAKQILSDGETRGNPLTKGQKGMFGAIAGGAPTKAKPPAKKASKAPPRKAQGPGIGGLAIGQRRRGGMMPPPLA
jgi:hypothetical protein